MELKSTKLLVSTQKLISFNRTFMELKLVNNLLIFMSSERFNRTFMELKLNLKQLYNSLGQKFQSYLYGIEIEEQPKTAEYDCCFNRTFMELK